MAVYLPRPGTRIAFHGHTPPFTLQVVGRQGPRPPHVGAHRAQALQGTARKHPRLQVQAALPHCKHGHAACEAWTRVDSKHTPLTGTNEHVRGLGASVVKRRQGHVTNGYSTRPHFGPQATTVRPNAHVFLSHHKHLHPSAPLPGKRRTPLNSLYYQGGVPTHLTTCNHTQ